MTEIPRSTYYYRRKKKREDADIQNRIELLVRDLPGYGYRRVDEQLRRDGLAVNHKRVLRIMRENSLLCQIKRAYRVTTNSRHKYPVFPNLTRGIIITGPNQVWYADITYIRLASGFAYLAVILDGYSRKVIGYALSERLTAPLALEALQMAIDERKPPQGCIHHSDQGVQYACDDYVAKLAAAGLAGSMSRKGNPYDNAKAESFMKTLKYEEVYLWEYDTVDEAAARIRHFIEVVYNRKRLHSALGYLPPDEFEAKAGLGIPPQTAARQSWTQTNLPASI
jgi:putative transposase